MKAIQVCKDLATGKNGARSRTKKLTRELTSHPFFPLLFIGEAAKTSAFSLVGHVPLDVVGIAWTMALLSVVGWLYSYEDVAWGLHQVKEAAEEVTDDENT